MFLRTLCHNYNLYLHALRKLSKLRYLSFLLYWSAETTPYLYLCSGPEFLNQICLNSRIAVVVAFIFMFMYHGCFLFLVMVAMYTENHKQTGFASRIIIKTNNTWRGFGSVFYAFVNGYKCLGSFILILHVFVVALITCTFLPQSPIIFVYLQKSNNNQWQYWHGEFQSV